MIVYAADRAMNILGTAATRLRKGLVIYDDIKTEDTETGVASFEFTVRYTKEQRKKAEEMLDIGNYILRKDGDSEDYFTITDYDQDTKLQKITVYAEDAGLDLLNDVMAKSENTTAHNIAWYVTQCISNTGFEIGKNEYQGQNLALEFKNEQTAKERLDEIAEMFGAEISYGFEIKGMDVTHKYIHIHQKRGKDKGVRLVLNRDIDRIRISKNINEIATGLVVEGGSPKNRDTPTTLSGLTYDDGDFYVSGKNLYSRQALQKWARFLPDVKKQATGVSAHIMRTYDSDTTDQETLLLEAILELTKLREAQVNYEVDIVKLPEDTALGDTVYIVDEAGELYLESRIIKLETRCSQNKKTATLGEFLIREGGISDSVRALAKRFSDYANNIKSQTVFDVLTEYTSTETVLTAKVYRSRKDITGQFTASSFTWYKKTEDEYTELGTGYTWTVSNDTMGYGGTIVCRFNEA